MRRLMITLGLLTWTAATLLAQSAPPANLPPSDLPPPPGALTASTPSDGEDVESCVEVEIGGAKALDCINRKLKREADKVAPVKNLPPVDARSQDIHLGIVNVPAVKQQYGPNFGTSAVPYRPSRTFTPPIKGP